MLSTLDGLGWTWRILEQLRNCKVTLTPPELFSMQAQAHDLADLAASEFVAEVSEDGTAWHFPVPIVPSRAEQLSSGRPLPRKDATRGA